MPSDFGGARPQPTPKPKKRKPAAKSPVFGPIKRADAPLTRPVRKPKPPAKPRPKPSLPPKASPAPAPHTDAQTSGPNYGVKKADRFKKTKQYKRTVRKVKTTETRRKVKKAMEGLANTGRLKPVEKPKLSAMGIDLHGIAGVAGYAASPLATALDAVGVHGPHRFVTNIFKDAVDLPANTVPATVHLASRAAHGDVKGVAKDLAQPYIELAKHPGKNLTEHPLNSYLLFSGVKGGAGRGAGRVMRSGALGSGAKRVASTARKPRTVEGTTLEEKRSYSPDVITKQFRQVPVEKARRASSKRLAAKAEKLHEAGKVEKAEATAGKAARRNPDRRMKDGAIQRRVDERVDANENVRRRHRADVTKKVDKAVPRKASAHVSLTAQGITKASKEDLRAYRRELDAAAEHLEGSKLAANKRLRRQIDKALVSGSEAEVAAAARAYVEVVRPLQAKLVKAGIVDAKQAERRTLMPHAVRSMGATHGKPAVTADVAGARSEVRAAVAERAKVERAQKSQAAKAGRAQGKAEVLTGQADRRRAKMAAGPPSKKQARAQAEMGRTPKRTLAKLEKERGALLKMEAVDVRRARERARGADQGLVETKALATKQRRAPAQLLDEHGKPLSDDAIRQHMKDGGFGDPAFVTQAPKSSNGYFVSSHRPATAGTKKFTGAATREGTFDASREALRENAARTQGLVDAQEGFGGTIGEFMRRDVGNNGTFKNRARADKAARDLMFTKDGKARPNAVEMDPVRLLPFAGKHKQLEAMLEHLDPDNVESMRPFTDALNSALKGEDGPGEWALIPRVARKRLQEHVNLLGPSAGKLTFQAINSAFRQTVLATSTRWLFGNTAETGLRAAVAHAGPRSLLTGMKVRKRMKELDPQKAEELDARAFGGGHYGMQAKMPRRGAEQFADTSLAPLANALHKLWQAPVGKQIADAWKLWTDIVFKQVNGRIEFAGQVAMAGKAIRTDGLMDGHLRKLSSEAIDQAARGLLNTNEQVALGRAVDRMYGRYSKFSPTKRQAVALYTPFIAWSLNAVEFLYRVLPRDHPVLTSLLVSANMVTEDWRKEQGLSKFVDGALPGFLQGTIPGKGGSHIQASRYTPFGFMADPGDTAASSVLPQFSSTLMAMKGKDWLGRDLTPGRESNDLENGVAAVKAFLESTVPAFSVTKRVVKDGPNKAFNPFFPIAPPKKKTPKSSGSGGGGVWGGEPSGGSSGGSSGGGWGDSGSKSKPSSNGGWG